MRSYRFFDPIRLEVGFDPTRVHPYKLTPAPNSCSFPGYDKGLVRRGGGFIIIVVVVGFGTLMDVLELRQ